ncbi:MAG TPA: DinB family protein [Caldilineaceae bacterium]|nr:DinB family protein [Caldilineaceae bacterium]
MNYHVLIQAQFRAALGMLEQAVDRCPDTLWNDANDKTQFWHIAYHALFYTHLYLQKSEADFQPWVKHHEHYELMGPAPWPPHPVPTLDQPYRKSDIHEYIDFCRQEVERNLSTLDLTLPSGFSWLPLTKFELQIYSIRHLQQHTGELMERLGTRAEVDVDWIGTRSE